MLGIWRIAITGLWSEVTYDRTDVYAREVIAEVERSFGSSSALANRIRSVQEGIRFALQEVSKWQGMG